MRSCLASDKQTIRLSELINLSIGRTPVAGTPPTQENRFVTTANVARKHAFPDVSFDSNGGMTLETFACRTDTGAQSRDSYRS